VLAQKWRPAKAAFYTADPAGAVYRLKAQFGFSRGDHLPERLGRNEPIVNQIFEHREPTFINNVKLAGKLADAMAQATTTRMLLAPLYLDGRIVGLVDVRDKAGRLPFAHDDVLEIADLLRAAVFQKREFLLAQVAQEFAARAADGGEEVDHFDVDGEGRLLLLQREHWRGTGGRQDQLAARDGVVAAARLARQHPVTRKTAAVPTKSLPLAREERNSVCTASL